jgi:release factor glutamine methyltransferase
MTWLVSDWFSAVPPDTRFQVIVANPPYLAATETTAAAPEVKDFEPVSALTAGENGLADIRAIVTQARPFLEPGGLLAIETGPEQHAAIKTLSAAAGWAEFASAPDLTGRDRFVFLR